MVDDTYEIYTTCRMKLADGAPHDLILGAISEILVHVNEAGGVETDHDPLIAHEVDYSPDDGLSIRFAFKGNGTLSDFIYAVLANNYGEYFDPDADTNTVVALTRGEVPQGVWPSDFVRAEKEAAGYVYYPINVFVDPSIPHTFLDYLTKATLIDILESVSAAPDSVDGWGGRSETSGLYSVFVFLKPEAVEAVDEFFLAGFYQGISDFLAVPGVADWVQSEFWDEGHRE